MIEKFKSNPIVSLLVVSAGIVSGIYLLPIHLILYFIIKPISYEAYRYLHIPFGWTWRALFAFKIDFWSNSKIILYTKSDAIEKIQTSYSLVIPNHSTEIDHFVLPSYGEKLDILGLSNAFVKKSLLYFPIIGQCFLFCCRFIFLDRSFDKDEKNIKRELVKYIELKYPGGSTLFFAEGTRFTEEKHKASIEFAKSKNLPIYKYHLLPRTKGFKACVEVMKKMKDKKCIIMHVQTYCKGPEPTVLNLFRGKSMEFHIFVEAIPIEEVEATDKWLFDLYQRKDDLHDSFEKFGNFYEGRKEVPIEGVELKPSLRVFVNGIFWCIVTFLSFFKFSIWMHQNGYTMTLLIILFTMFYLVSRITKECSTNKQIKK